MESVYPESFARFYDTLYHFHRDTVDNEFFLGEIKKCQGKVLEIGAGTGRFFSAALNSGADIYAIDISRAMLDVLVSKIPADQQFRVSLQDMLSFSFDFSFDLIIAPFRVMMHLIERPDQMMALDNVFNHLNPGGRFIFDTFVPDLKPLINGLDRVTDFDGEYMKGKRLKRVISTVPDTFNQIINIHFHLDWDEDDGKKSDDWHTRLRYYFRFELEHLIERSRFGKYRIMGDYNGNPLSSSSRDFVVECEKTG